MHNFALCHCFVTCCQLYAYENSIHQNHPLEQLQSTFHVDHRHEEEQSPRSRYESESRTIVINLDHPQIARSAREGGIDGKQFQEMTREIAFVEYAIALGYEKLRRDEFYSSSEMLLDIRDTINRVSQAI